MDIQKISMMLNWFGTVCLALLILQLFKAGFPIIGDEINHLFRRLFRR